MLQYQQIRLALLITLGPLILLLACESPETSKQVSANPSAEATKLMETKDSISTNFTINPKLCSDQQGPDCTLLKLGDKYFSTGEAKKGFLYSCNEKNPNAPGSIEKKITWINFAGDTWNLLQKLWLPEASSNYQQGTYSEILVEGKRQIEINNMPVDKNIGNWPMTNYPSLTIIDGNPGIPSSFISNFAYPSSPVKEESPTCVSLGAIGVTKNGVVIYNAADARGEDAVAREIVDVFGGHPAGSNYHYHFIPERLDDQTLDDGHSGIVGYINDGFPLYGYKGKAGVEMSNEDLDICHGHGHDPMGYHYHATIEYPYTVGCYKGNPISMEPNQMQPANPFNRSPRGKP